MARETLGRRLRQLRLSKQCSISELSAASGIGKGTISELENGKRDARMETLFALTTALEAPLGAVLTREGEGSSTDMPVSGDSVHAVLLSAWTVNHEHIEVYRARLTPEVQSSSAHGVGVAETVTVLEGAVRVGPEGQVRELTRGESLHYPGDRPHSFSSVAGEASALLVMHYPHQQKEMDR
jgi:transcriptional regulator with XRE-family HTH domain